MCVKSLVCGPARAESPASPEEGVSKLAQQLCLAQSRQEFTGEEVIRQSFLDGDLLLMNGLKRLPNVVGAAEFPRQIQPRVKRLAPVLAWGACRPCFRICQQGKQDRKRVITHFLQRQEQAFHALLTGRGKANIASLLAQHPHHLVALLIENNHAHGKAEVLEILANTEKCSGIYVILHYQKQ